MDKVLDTIADYGNSEIATLKTQLQEQKTANETKMKDLENKIILEYLL